MPRSTDERGSPQPPADTTDAAGAPREVSSSTSAIPTSPARSDKSSESEGKPVREKLKETRIDGQASSDPAQGSDQPMNDVTNGNTHSTTGDQNTSESENGRGRILRRKRSHDDYDEDLEKPTEKKVERHVRKKSRDVTSPKNIEDDILPNPPQIPVARIDETMVTVDEPQSHNSTSNGPATPDAPTLDKQEAMVTSPNNKRTRDQAKTEEGSGSDIPVEDSKGLQSSDKAEEPSSKRPKDKDDVKPSKGTEETKTKIPPTSGFANFSAASPFATLSSKPKASTTTDKNAPDPPQTSDDKFKSSGFGSFAASTTSPFGSIGGSGANSPFAAATSGSKPSGFASPPSSSSSTAGGFAALGGSSSKSVFGGSSAPSIGGSVFGGGLSKSGFGGLGGTNSGLSSFASPGVSTITGLSKKPDRPFGATQEDESEGDGEDDEGNDDETQDSDEGERSKSTNPVPVETGEEGEEPVWTGRAKLYTLAGEGEKKGWQERGAGPFKLNVTKDAPIKARFILRADGTHRLLLNAALIKTLKFGDAQGAKPTDGKLLFSSPAGDGTIEMHLLRMRNEKAAELWKTVEEIKNSL